MSRTLQVTLWTLAGIVVGFIGGQQIVYGLLGIRPGDRTDLFVLLAIVVLFAVLGFWWGRRASRQ
jgi:hypothetical protein